LSIWTCRRILLTQWDDKHGPKRLMVFFLGGGRWGAFGLFGFFTLPRGLPQDVLSNTALLSHMLCSKFSSPFHIPITCCNPSSNMNIYIEEPLEFQLLICDGPIKISHWEDKKFELEKPPLQKWKVQNWKQGEMSKSLLLLTDWSLQNALLFFKILISLFGKNKKKLCKGWWGGVVMVEIMVGIMTDLKTYVDSGGRC